MSDTSIIRDGQNAQESPGEGGGDENVSTRTSGCDCSQKSSCVFFFGGEGILLFKKMAGLLPESRTNLVHSQQEL